VYSLVALTHHSGHLFYTWDPSN